MLSNYSYVVDGVVAGSAMPKGTPEEILVAFKREGFGSIVNLTEHPAKYAGAAAEAGIRCFHIPIADFGAPSQDDMRAVSALVLDKENYPMLMHCRAGIGRTGTMLAVAVATLRKSGDVNIDGEDDDKKEERATADVVGYVRGIRPGSLEVLDQVQAFKEFEKELCK